jgi:hypothetical protein
MINGEPWTEDRLQAAFVTRAARMQTPAHLEEAVLERVRQVGPAPKDRIGRRWLGAAAVVAVLAGGLGLATLLPGVGNETSSVPPSAARSPTATALPIPEVFGLSILSVAQAIEIRDSGEDDQELAAQGLVIPPDATYDCLTLEDPSALEQGCVSEVDDIHLADATGIGRMRVLFLTGITTGLIAPDEPAPVILIGHFDDRRASRCPAGERRAACQDLFVVDRIHTVDGVEQAFAFVDLVEREPSSTLDEILGLIRAVSNWQPLSVTHIDRSTGLEVIEPLLRCPDNADCVYPSGASMWLVRVLEDRRVRTFGVSDLSQDIYEITTDDIAQIEIEPSPSGQSAQTFDVRIETSEPGNIGVPAHVVDQTGSVAQVRSATQPELASFDWYRRAHVDNLDADALLVRWIGTVCDTPLTITISDRDGLMPGEGPVLLPTDIEIAGHRPGCDAMALARGLVIALERPVDAATVTAQDTVVVDRIDEDGPLAIAGRNGVPGRVTCAPGTFDIAAMDSPTGAENQIGPEYEALRRAFLDPGFADAFADGAVDDMGWRVVSRSRDEVVFLTEKPPNGDERYWAVAIASRNGGSWLVRGAGDCQPRPVLPTGFGSSTWELNPAFPKPKPTTRTLHLLVTEEACAGGMPAVDRLSPAYVITDPYRITIAVGVRTLTGGQRCPGNPAAAVTIELLEPIGNRELVDPMVERGAGG